MRTELGELFLRTRLNLGWNLQELGRRLGLRNLNRAARRLERLERDGREADDLVDRAAVALGIDPQEVAEAKTRDAAARRAAFEAWCEVPQPMELLGYACGVTFGMPLPEGLTEEQAIAYALDAQKKRGHRVCLVLNRRRTLWIQSDGRHHFSEASPDQPNFPYTTVG